MAKDVDKTIRPAAGNADKTIRPADLADKTIRPSAQAEKTMRPVGADKTMRADQQEVAKIIQQQFTEFVLNKVKYQYVQTISESTSEAQVFLVESKGKQYALKLYYSGVIPPPDHDIMELIKKSSGAGFLVDTFDHGVWTDPQTSEKRDYELMEYCAGGSLALMNIPHDAKGEKMLKEIAVRCAVSLDFLHKKGMIHRDVKPSNFFFRDNSQTIGNMALADFDTSVRSDKDGKATIDFQLRAKFFAGPEYYDMVDGKIQISYKSDFYSLGMALLALWNGDELSKINEFELVNLKKNNKLPYPKDIDDRNLQLMKALTLSDPNARAGFAEITRWAKGEDIYSLKGEKDDIRKFKIVFNPTKNQIAQSPEELGKIMSENSDLAIRYLYSGKIAQWLLDNARPDLAKKVENFVEKKYPKDNQAGLLATCYLLDENMPYYDVNKNPLNSPQEIAKSLRDNMKRYETELSTPNHSLFLFFNARGAENVSKLFASFFKKDANVRDIVLQLMYTLDPTTPWTIVTDDRKTIECRCADDVLHAKYQYNFSRESWDDLTGEGFLTWLRHVEPALEGKIRSVKGYNERPTIVLYNLNPKVSFNFQIDGNADDYFFTAEQIGYFMNIRMSEYIINKNDVFANDQLNQMQNIDNSPLYDYLKSKRAYNDKIKWIKYCADLQSKDNANKAGPYNWQIGVYKAIKGLGFNPFYYFAKSDKYVYTLDELRNIPANEIKDEIKNGFLQEWLATFYQEDPFIDLSPQYEYEKKTIEYLEHIKKLDSDDVPAKRFQDAKRTVNNLISVPTQKRKIYLLSKMIGGAATLIAAILAILWIFAIDFTDIQYYVDNNMGNQGMLYTFFIVGTFLLATKIVKKFKLGAIGGFIVIGLLFLFYFLSSYMQILFLVFLGMALIWFFIENYLMNQPNTTLRPKVSNPTFEELELEPLYFAFSKETVFKSSIVDTDYDNHVNGLKKGINSFYKGLIVPWLCIIGLVYIVYMTKTKSENYTISKGVTEYVEGMAAVNTGNVMNRKWGFKNESDSIVIPCIYSDVSNFSEGLAAVKKDKWGYIDKAGNEIIPFKYDFAESFADGMAAVKKDGKCGFINKEGAIIIALKYESIRPFIEGLAAAKKDGRWGFIDKKDKTIIAFTLDEVRPFSGNLAPVKKNGKWGFVSKNDKMKGGFDYDELGEFIGDLAKAGRKKLERTPPSTELKNVMRYGVVNKSGVVIVPLDFLKLTIHDDMIEAKIDDYSDTQYFDKNGKRIKRK